jgi:hypothetical protein
MPINHSLWAMIMVETGLWMVLSFLFFRKRHHWRFPMMGSYLLAQSISTPAVAGVLYIQSIPRWSSWCTAYFFAYYLSYILGGVLQFLVCIEVFQVVMEDYSILRRIGAVAIRSVAVIACFFSILSVVRNHGDWRILPAFGYYLMHSVSLIELVLLGGLCLGINSLRQSLYGMAFGISLSLGVVSSGDFVLSALGSWRTTFNDPLQYWGEWITILSLVILGVYSMLRVPEKIIEMPVSLTLYKLNELAGAIGYRPKVVVMQPANGLRFSGKASAAITMNARR